MLLTSMRTLVAIVGVAACGGAGMHTASRDVAALFAEDAELTLVGGATLHGRAAISSAFDALSTRYEQAHVAIGRTWDHGASRAIEFVVTARRGGKQIGLVGAAAATTNSAGLIAMARVYLDVPTLVGQVDPLRLPAGAKTRAPITHLPAATIVEAGGPTELANLATTNEIWAHLDAHDPAGTVAFSSSDYRYDDYSGPAPLDRDGLQKLLVGFLGLVQDFTIVDKPTYFAAGPFVVTESVEHMTYKGAPVVLHALDVKQFAAGKVVHEWQYANGAEVFAALLGVAIDPP